MVNSLARHHSSGGTEFLRLRIDIGDVVSVARFIPALLGPERRNPLSLSLSRRRPLLSSSPLTLPLPGSLLSRGGNPVSSPRLPWCRPRPDLPGGRVPVPGHTVTVTSLSAFFSSAGWTSVTGCKKMTGKRSTRNMQIPSFSRQTSLPRSRPRGCDRAGDRPLFQNPRERCLGVHM